MTRWGKVGLYACALTAFTAMQTVHARTIEVFPAFAPNGAGSPNWPGYVTNAIDGIEAGGVETGSGTRDSNPAKYVPVSAPILPNEMIYSPYNSWRGTGAPNPVFTNNLAVQNEFGNRIHFGLHARGEAGMEFALNDVQWSLDSDDGDDYFDQSGMLTGAYGPARVGIDWVDGIKGNGDDVVYNSGQAGTLPVNELIYVGVGDGIAAADFVVPDQADLDLTLDGVDFVNFPPVLLTGKYTIGGDMGSGSVLIVPEPASILLLNLSILVGIVGIRRKRR